MLHVAQDVWKILSRQFLRKESVDIIKKEVYHQTYQCIISYSKAFVDSKLLNDRLDLAKSIDNRKK
jgi:hypothetical protein